MYNMDNDMNDIGSILETLASSCPHVEVTDLGHGRHYIGTGFTYDDGDELRIILKRGDDGGWILSDEGHTPMWLSYGGLEMTPSLGSMMGRLLRQNRARSDSGRITVDIGSPGEVHECLRSMVQAMIQVADMSFLNRGPVSDGEPSRGSQMSGAGSGTSP